MVCLDGGRSLEQEFFNQLVKPDGNPWDNRTKTAFHIIYDENSVSARKTRVRGMLSLSETMLVYTTDSALQVTKKNRMHYPGTTHGLAIQGVGVPTYSEMWLLDRSQKVALYGTLGKVLASGSMPGADEVPRPEFGSGANLEPVAWHSSTVTFYEELLSALNVKAVLDATASDASLAIACLRLKVAYAGVVWTETHRNLLDARILKQLFLEYRTESSPLYQPLLCKLMKEAEQAAKEDKDETKGDESPKVEEPPKKKAKSKAKAQVNCRECAGQGEGKPQGHSQGGADLAAAGRVQRRP